MKLATFARAAGIGAAATLAVCAYAQSSWTRQSPFPTDRNPKAVFALTPTKAVFAGSNRMILDTGNAGASWTIRSLGDWGVDPYYGVKFKDPQNGYVVGNNSMLRTTNGGATWFEIEFHPGSWYFVDFVSSSVGFAGSNGGCAATSDGGSTWTIRSGWPTCPVMFGMDFRDANVGLVGGLIAGSSIDGIFKTSDGGRTWTLKDTWAANDVLWMSSTRAIADGGMTVRESLDAGETWHPIAYGIQSGLLSMARAGTGSVVVGVSGKGDVWRSADGGYNWLQTFDGPGSLPEEWDIHFADELHGWIVGPGGFFYYSSDGGFTWQQKNNGCNAQVSDLHMFDADYGLAVGRNGYMFRTENGGAFWDIQKLEVTGQIWGRDEDLVALDIVDRQFAVTAGPGGTAFKTEDGGDTWTSIGYPNLSGVYWIYDIDFVDQNLGYVYGVDDNPPHTRTLHRTTDGGASWEWVDLGERGGGTTVQFVDSQYGWLTADNDFGLRTVDGGATWLPFTMPTYYTSPEISKVRFLNRNEGWSAGWFGYLARTTNGGVSWNLVNLGTIEDDFFDVVPLSSTDIWLCGRETGTNIGVVYHTTNGFQTWTRQEVTDWFYYPYRIWALPSGDAWFGGYAGAIFRNNPAQTVVPATAWISPGRHIAGTVASLAASDDDAMAAGVAANLARNARDAAIVAEAVSPSAAPSSLGVRWESKASAPGTLQYVELWNFALARWDLVDQRPSSLADTAGSAAAGNPGAYVEPGTRRVRARLRWRAPSPADLRWRGSADRFVWTIGQ